MRSARFATMAIIVCLFFSKVTHAQQTNPNAALTPYATWEGGKIDQLDMETGSLFVKIPLTSYPQRGALKLSFSLISNNLGWYCAAAGSNYCTWTTTVPEASFSPVEDNNVSGGLIGQCRSGVYTFGVKTADGGNHTGGITSGALPTSCPGTFPIVLETSDGSGFRVVYDGTGNHLIDRDGVTHNQNGPYEEDANGNFITLTSSTNTLTDSLGRSIPWLNPLNFLTTDYRGCTGPLPIVKAGTWTVPSLNGGTAVFKFCYATVNLQTNFQMANTGDYTGAWTFLQSVVLPNGTTWTFEYSSRSPGDPANINYGDLTKVTFPTGGTISYSYVNSTGTSGYTTTRTRVLSSRTVDANDGTGGHAVTYQWGSYIYPATSETNISTDSLGNDTVYTNSNIEGALALGIWRTVNKKIYKGSHTTGTLLQTVTTDWTLTSCKCNFPDNATFPIRVTTVWPNGKTSKVETDYDSQLTFTNGHTSNYGNVIAKREYDYGSGTSGLILRTTTSHFQAFSNASYLSNNLLNLPSSVQVSDGSGNQAAYTTFGYDETPLASSGIGSSQQHDTSPASGTARGNLTSIHQWLNASVAATTNCNIAVSNGYLISFRIYYDTGKLNESTDSCGQSAGDPLHTTTYAYSSTYVGAFPTSVTNPKGQSTTYTYDFNTGLPISTVDPNGQTKTNAYDNMLRLFTVSYPDGGLESHTHQESAFPFTTTITEKITSTQNKATTYVLDGMGRVSQSQLADPQGTIYTDQGYDGDGREASRSNPYRSKTTDSTYGVTQYQYDALDRPTLVTKPDGSTIQTAYCDNTTLVTDESGRWRRSTTDGLGRSIEVDEPNSTTATVNACPGTGEPTWVTTYSYDALDDLKTVAQGGSRNRNFAYDSLKHLISSANPEAGTVTYGYDADGDVITKTDARGFTTTYGYDALNRMTGRTYSNGDPAVSYTYDQSTCIGQSPCYNIGRRTSMTDAAGSESASYDKMGRDWSEQRTTGGITKSTSYTYNFDGSLATLTYPSGRMISYKPDSSGRPSEAQDIANNINYATGTCANGVNNSGTCFAPQGAVGSLALGQSGSFAGIILSNTYNKRLEPNELRASSSAGTAIDLTYNFVDTNGHNNGNVIAITNNKDNTRSQNFAYDQVNRITSGQTSSTTGSNCWGETFSFDQWANMTAIGAVNGYTGCMQENLGVIATATNQLSSVGFSYDPSGNMLSDGANSYAWNAESEVKTANTTNYTYDGDGDRVEKSNGKIYWYGVGTEILDESDLAGNITDEYVFFGGNRIAHRDVSNSIYYYAADFLDTSRVLTTSNGSVCYEADFYPYGGERIITNSCPQNYKFEGKERDSETGNDDFGARYYASRLGRWLSPDWSAIPAPVPYADLTNPQTLNLYAMVHDNPESFADLDGHAQTADQIRGSGIRSAWEFDTANSRWLITTSDGKSHIWSLYGGTPSVNVAENVILDADSNGGQGLSGRQLGQFKSMQKETEELYRQVNIYFTVTYTNGVITWGDDGKPVDISGAVSGKLNVFVMSGYLPPQFHGAWGNGDGESTIQKLGGKSYAFTFIGLLSSPSHWLLSHEFAHHFLGNTLGGANLAQQWMGEMYINRIVLPHIQSYGGTLRKYASSPIFSGLSPSN